MRTTSLGAPLHKMYTLLSGIYNYVYMTRVECWIALFVELNRMFTRAYKYHLLYQYQALCLLPRV